MSSNAELEKFLSTCNNDSLWLILGMMDSIFLMPKNNLKKQFTSPKKLPKLKSNARFELSKKIVNQLSYFGSHTFNYYNPLIKKNTQYKIILKDVLQLLKKDLKSKQTIPKVGTVKEYELLICNLLIENQLANISKEKVIEMFQESGLDIDESHRSAVKLIKTGIKGITILKLVKILGKKTLTHILYKVVFHLLVKRIGQEAAKEFIKKLAKKIPQKVISRYGTYIGAAFLVKDIVDLGKPANRITVPCVCLISVLRAVDSYI